MWPMRLNTSTLCFRRIDFAVYKGCEKNNNGKELSTNKSSVVEDVHIETI